MCDTAEWHRWCPQQELQRKLKEDCCCLRKREKELSLIRLFSHPPISFQGLPLVETRHKPAEVVPPDKQSRARSGWEWIQEHTAKDLLMGLKIIPTLLACL